MNKQGFTMLELMMVVLIISILAAIALPKYQRAVLKAKTVEAVTTAKSVMDAAAIYAAAYRECPAQLSDLDIRIAGIDSADPTQATGKYWQYALGNYDAKACYVDITAINQPVSFTVQRVYIYKTGASQVPTVLTRGQIYWTGDGSQESKDFFKAIQAEERDGGAYYL